MSNILYERRKELGLTLEEVGKRVGVGKSTVKKWETGYISNMGRDKIILLANALEISPMDIINPDKAGKPNYLGSAIKDIRRKKHLTQEDLSRLTGMAQNTISNHENQKRELNETDITKYAQALGVSPQDFYNGFKSKNTSINNIFSNNLNHLMKLHGENLTQLSDRLTVAYSTISDWQRGKKMPRSKSLQKIARHFNVNVAYLTSIHTNQVEDVEQIQLSDVIGKYAGDRDIFISHINGESMNRVIPNHSMIAVKKFNSISDLKDGDIVVFQDHGDMSVKRFYNDKRSKIISFTPDSTDTCFHPINCRYEDIDEIKIVGKVVVYTVEL